MSFDEDDDNASQEELSENEDADENMEDADDGDADADADGDENGEADADADEGDGDGDEDDGDGEGDGEGDNDEDEDEVDSPTQNRQNARRVIQSPKPLSNGVAGPSESQAAFTTPSPRSQTANIVLPYYPTIRQEAIEASTYDIVPTIAAPHSTSINTIAATPDMRWIFTGGTDGYIRKFNWVDSANGKLMLTVAQRHPFVDSVTKAGVLLSYWENEEPQSRTPSNHITDDGINLSPVYSLAVQNQGLWLLSGLESGGINLQTIRHNEGTRVTTLRKHTSAVSVLHLAPDERSVLSGSWDKTINDWDLNTGQVRRTYIGSTGQVSSIEPRPFSSVPIPEQKEEAPVINGTFSSNNARATTNGALLNGTVTSASQDIAAAQSGLTGSPQEDAAGSPDMNSLFGDDDPPLANGDNDSGIPGFGDDDDDEFSRAIANGLQQDADDQLNRDIEMADAGGPVQPPEPVAVVDEAAASQAVEVEALEPVVNGVPNSTDESAAEPLANGLPVAEETQATETQTNSVPETTVVDTDPAPPQTSTTTFLSSSFDGSIRIWDSRSPNPIARIAPPRNTPPWCMSACWSPDGNSIYAGRRNNAVDEYNIHHGLREPRRTFKFPAGSGAVSAVKAMPNGRNLVCASHDILRLYDLQHDAAAASSRGHSVVPFLIIPGHRTGVISQLYIDPTCTFLISTAGNRGWEGASTEVLLGYEIGCVGKA